MIRFETLVRHDDDYCLENGRPIPRFVTLYVVKPGAISSRGFLREPGTCLAKAVLPGDKLLDVLTLRRSGASVEVESAVLIHEDFNFDDVQNPYFDRERTGFRRVQISGRAASWGALGDDTYSDESADEIFRQIVLECITGTAKWSLAQIYYDCKTVPESEGWKGTVAEFDFADAEVDDDRPWQYPQTEEGQA